MPISVDQLLLPFAEREYIDMRRAMRILGLSHSSVRNLFLQEKISIVDYRKGSRKRVRYSSIVDLCDRLRAEAGIPDRRPKLDAPHFRHRDEDLLPFPLSDTIGIKDVQDILGYASRTPIYKMIEEGRFEAYKLATWRFSRTSFAAYMQYVRERESRGERTPASHNCFSLSGAHLQ